MRSLCIRTRLAAQRQSHRLIASDPEHRGTRVAASLRQLTDAAQPRAESPETQRTPRTTPFCVLDADTRQRHAAAERSWQAATADLATHQPPAPARLARAQAQERSTLATDQSIDRTALRQLHRAEWESHRERTAERLAEARSQAVASVREALQPRWQAVRAMPEKAERTAAAKELGAEQRTRHVAARAQAVADARPHIAVASASLRTLHGADRERLVEAHVAETAALSRVHATERLALHTRSPAISSAAADQRDLVRDLRNSLVAYRQTCRLVATGGLMAGPQATRAATALARVLADDHQRQQRAGAVARGGGSDADRANASPREREQADRAARAERQRKGTQTPQASQSTGQGKARSSRDRS